ncbi:MFS transporter [Criblamydia sequanensis]|uniref:Permease n=1 Tax=Candidatus Criblamydia sequanensis CRIB-18 TaxID=1437425 RepID=A0A090CYN9_9BACT|nr:MFS transporter [Criblamydia sequanensis]CDR33636.1 Permease [Criblamydia sequanensis CRIB-18]
MTNFSLYRSNDQASISYFWARVLDTPLWAIFNMLPFILLKDFKASVFQLAVFIAIKPIVSLFSSYWSSMVHGRPKLLKTNIILAKCLGSTLFFLVPFFQSSWLLVIASAIYMCLAVGALPAWMEILKRNLTDVDCKKTFAYGSSIGYLGGGILPLALGWILDGSPQAWKWIFPLSALISLSSLPLIIKIKVVSTGESRERTRKSFLSYLLGPWKKSFEILSKKRDFLLFQIGFMVMGTGLMLMQPALPIFFVDGLGMSYVELALALSVCKGISYALSSPLWAARMQKMDIFKFSASVTALACLFPVFLILAKWNFLFVFAAYVGYGAMQAGSELSWNLSGPIFSKKADSSPYTAVNVVTVGIRGLFAPALGSFFCQAFGSESVLCLGGGFFLAATALLLHFSKNYEETGELAA